MIIRERQTSNPFLDDPIFRQFFGDRFRQLPPREQKAQGLGAGTIVTSDGYILTANHVIEGAESVKVALASTQKEYDAKVIGADPPTDVAVRVQDADGRHIGGGEILLSPRFAQQRRGPENGRRRGVLIGENRNHDRTEADNGSNTLPY